MMTFLMQPILVMTLTAIAEANIITDFAIDTDVIGVGGLGITSTEELTFTQVGNDTAITFSDSDLAILQNTQASNLQADATFIFA